MEHRMHYALMLVVLLAMVACGVHVKVTPLAQVVYSPTTSCEVFTSGKPDRAFTELAIIEVYQGGNSIAIAKQKAMAMGADAIILTGRGAYGQVQVAPGIAGTAEKMIFTAVKWK